MSLFGDLPISFQHTVSISQEREERMLVAAVKLAKPPSHGPAKLDAFNSWKN